MNKQPKTAVAGVSKSARDMNNRLILPVHWIRQVSMPEDLASSLRDTSPLSLSQGCPTCSDRDTVTFDLPPQRSRRDAQLGGRSSSMAVIAGQRRANHIRLGEGKRFLAAVALPVGFDVIAVRAGRASDDRAR